RGRGLDVQRQDRPDQLLGNRVPRQQPLRRRERQRLQEQGRRVAAAFVERLVGRGRRFVVGGSRVAGAKRRRRPLRRILEQRRRLRRQQRLGRPFEQRR